MSESEDQLVAIYGSIGLILRQLRELSDAVEALRADVRVLIDAQRQKDQP